MSSRHTGKLVHHGFTLIELLVVIAIIATLVALLFPVFAQARQSRDISISPAMAHMFESTNGLYSQDYDEKAPLADFHYMPPVGVHSIYTANFRGHRNICANNQLAYNGGVGGVGVAVSPKIYLVFYGKQWGVNGITSTTDPSNEAGILQSFYSSVGGSSWNNSVTQYCQGVTTGSVSCGAGTVRAGNPAGMLAGVWLDNTVTAQAHPTQAQLGAEAARAAQYFGNTTPASNQYVQYVICTSKGNSASGFKTQYCAWHSYTTSSTAGNIAYTNLPYMTDGGANCGANYQGLGATAGITIVGGHEMAETESDQFPSGGWIDSTGAENGDKCAWISTGQGATAMVTFPNGNRFPVQSLWSNAFNNNAGGCVLSYP